MHNATFGWRWFLCLSSCGHCPMGAHKKGFKTEVLKPWMPVLSVKPSTVQGRVRPDRA
jgi:hypothetical protein